MAKTNLEFLWDERKVCANPHKGWYLHYFDNSLTIYGPLLKPGDFLEDFPGLNHIYLRVDWSHLEPQEGRYAWEVIDQVIADWVAHGYRVSFRICCKETSPGFAAPEWVMRAGAKGVFFPADDGQCWEPDYGDPVFLEKLDNFHRVFAQRYGKQPWLEFVDIGSYGDWGEGHTSFASRRDWPVDVIKRHIDIHLRHYRDTFILMNYAMACDRRDAEGGDAILQYAVAKGLGLRDDSVCVESYAKKYGFSTLMSPEIFNLVCRKRPVDMELAHYSHALSCNTWKGGLPLLKAVEESHASFVGFHGDARKWLAENPEIAVRIANRAGYWYFLKSVEVSRGFQAGSGQKIGLVWENRGVAPAYHRYKLSIRLANATGQYTQEVLESDNRNWMPNEIGLETHCLQVPGTLPAGKYKLGIALHDERIGKRNIELAFKDGVLRDGFYEVADVEVTNP